METLSHSPDTSTEHARNALSDSEIESLRAAQRETYSRLYAEHSAEDPAAVEVLVNDEMNNSVAGFLGDHHLSPDDPRYDTYHAAIRGLSYDNLSDTSWRYGEWRDDEHTELGPTGHDRLTAKQTELFGAPTIDTITAPEPAPEPEPAPDDTPDTPEDTEDPDDTPETNRLNHPALIAARENDSELMGKTNTLNRLRDELAALAAKQLGQPIAWRGRDKYNDTRQAYNNALEQVGRQEQQILDDKIARNAVDKNVDFVHFIMAEQTKLRDATRELFANTKTTKFIEWFNRGGRMKRIAKGMLVGAPITIVGAVLAPVTAAGVGIAATAVGGSIIAGRFTRNYARHDGSRSVHTTEESINADEFATHLQRSGGTIENAVAYADEKFDRDKKDQQIERRKAVAWGIGGIAMGTLAGEAAALARETGFASAAWDVAKDVGGHVKHFLKYDPNTPVPPLFQDGNGGSTPIEHNPYPYDPTDHVGDKVIDNPIDTSGVHEQSLDWSDFSPNAHNVVPGEGWNQTMDDFGIPHDKWAETLQQAGPELQKQGWAYFDKSHNEWRISRPGKLPLSVLKVFAASSKKSGFTLGA